MISNRSESFSRGLALAVLLVLGGTACMNTQGASHGQTLEVRVDTHASSRNQRRAEPEFFAGESAPEVPAALVEERPSAPSSAHVWVGGHHTRRDGEWAWVAGRYVVPPSTDVVWVPGHWVSHLDGFAWIDGGWR